MDTVILSIENLDENLSNNLSADGAPVDKGGAGDGGTDNPDN